MDSIKNALNNISLTNTKSLFKYISTPICMYFVWIILHYISAHLYKMHCAPSGIWGFLLSPLMASTPYCTGLVWIMQNSAVKFMAIWAFVGSWINITLNNVDLTSNKTSNRKIQTEETYNKED